MKSELTRWEAMHQLHASYFPLYKKTVQNYLTAHPEHERVIQMLDSFVIGRIGTKPGIRAYVLAQMFELADCSLQTLMPIIAAIELQLASQYCWNVVMDEKAGYTKSDRPTAFRARDITCELARDLVKTSAPRKVADVIVKILERINDEFYLGQILDTLIVVWSNRDLTPQEILQRELAKDTLNIFGIDKSLFTHLGRKLTHVSVESILGSLMWQRTYAINAAMIEHLADIAAATSGIDEAKHTALRLWGRYYGLSMQIINDLQDFSLDLIGENTPREKNAGDVFSDVLTNKVTWPMYYLGNESIAAAAYEQPSMSNLERLREFLCYEGAMQRVVLESIAYAKLANSMLVVFPKSLPRMRFKDIAMSMAKLSKYISALEKRYSIKLVPPNANIDQRMHELEYLLSRKEGMLLKLFL